MDTYLARSVLAPKEERPVKTRASSTYWWLNATPVWLGLGWLLLRLYPSYLGLPYTQLRQAKEDVLDILRKNFAWLLQDRVLYVNGRLLSILARQWFLPGLCAVAFINGAFQAESNGPTGGIAMLLAFIMGTYIKVRQISRLDRECNEISALVTSADKHFRWGHILTGQPLIMLLLILGNIITYGLQILGFVLLPFMLLFALNVLSNPSSPIF